MISAAIILRDSEKDIANCLDSLQGFADEIICVIDSRTTDATEQICRHYTDKVFIYEWQSENYANARNYSLSKCSGEWVFVIDADETLMSFEKPSEDYDAVSCIVRNVYEGLITDYSSPRLFRKEGVYYQFAVHEDIRHCLNDKRKKYTSNILIQHKEKNKEQVIRKAEYLLPLHLKQLSEEQGNPFVKGQISYCYKTLKNWHEAIDWAGMAMYDNAPNETKAQNCINLFECYNAINEIEKARFYLNLSIAICPEQLSGRAILKDILLNEGRTAEAEIQLNEIKRVGNLSRLPFDITYQNAIN